MEEACEELQKAKNSTVQSGWDELAPLAAADNYKCAAEGAEEVNFLEEVVLFERQSQNMPANSDKRAALRTRFTTEKNQKILSEEQYIRQFQSLNAEQKTVVLFNKQWCEAYVNALNCRHEQPEARDSI